MSTESMSLQEPRWPHDPNSTDDIPPDIPQCLLQVLKNNAPPPPHALQTAMSLKEEPAVRVAHIDARLTAIEAQIRKLQEEESHLKNEAEPLRNILRVYDTVLAPLRRVPFDILREIALHALPDKPTARRDQAPMSLCQVTSAWRFTVLSSPLLWSTLYVGIPGLDGLPKYQRRIEQCFTHAKNQPLSLFLAFDEEVDLQAGDVPKFKNFLLNISPIIVRVRHLGLASLLVDQFLGHLEGIHWNLTSLEVLELRTLAYNTRRTSLPAIPPLQHFLHATSLRRLRVEQDFFNISGAASIMPWSSLTHVILEESINTLQWLRLMKVCPLIQVGQFIVDGVGGGDDEAIFSTEIVQRQPTCILACLEDFRIEVRFEGPSLVELLTPFTLPALRRLDVTQNANISFHIPPPQAYLNIRNLRFLSLNEGWESSDPGSVSVQRLLDILRETVHLETLIFTNCSEDCSTFFAPMTFKIDGDATVVLPRLAVLRMQLDLTFWTRGFDTHALVNMLESRSGAHLPAGCSPLKFFTLIAWDHDVAEMAARELQPMLSLCKDAGMTVDIRRDESYFRPERRLECAFNGWRPLRY